ncbi:MAG: class I SAM-dependent methyltransferase [Actinomycetota bacterium]|nr:class I SAM-dependent methyltransferase [Actinomycetota bacterium]
MEVDLEDLAAGYAHRPSSPAALARAQRAAQSVHLGKGDVAIDLGGGRGQHAAVWAERGALALVVDPARGMVQVAAQRKGVAAICAYSQNLPLSKGSVRLAYFHLSLHYGDWKAALDETRRVLSADGECWIWTMGEAHHRASLLAKWFPSVGDIDAARFPEPQEVAGYLLATTSNVEMGRETETKVMPAGQWRAAVAAKFVSTLQLIPKDEFDRGLAGFDLAYPKETEMVEYNLTFDWLRVTA